MTEYLVRINEKRDIIRVKAEKLELRDGALIFYFLDETEGYKIARVIAAGEWIEIVRGIEND